MGQPSCWAVTLYVGAGCEKEQWCLLRSLSDLGPFRHFPGANWAPLVPIPMWVGLCTLWVFPRTSPVRLGVSPCASTPTGVLNQCPKALFPSAGILGCTQCAVLCVTIATSLGLPVATPWPGSSRCLRPLWSCAPGCLTRLVPTLSALRAWLSDSAPPTGLGEGVYFNSLVVRLLYSSIFCQFWLLFCF
ncbi:hypothetical protein HJG60_011726 [Phyllostomus discolor]|uniref:Uncharacterized protein n=1 Tax=Phyllostomus discolor TaxID=89673 RepID=A0A834DXL7_9CHIR|nr:hypothetical protein HJG60_011726 [Phyllostomus discolor]